MAARERGAHITAEVTPHHLTLTHEEVAFGDSYERVSYNAHAKVNPPLREQADIDSLVEALRDGVIDAIATDHAPHATIDKEIEFDLAAPGISGLETGFGLTMSLVHEGKLDLPALIERLTAGRSPRGDWIATPVSRASGRWRPARPATSCCSTRTRRWTVDPTEFASLGRNTPLAGRALRGRVVATVYGGEMVHALEGVAAL